MTVHHNKGEGEGFKGIRSSGPGGDGAVMPRAGRGPLTVRVGESITKRTAKSRLGIFGFQTGGGLGFWT